MEVLQCRVPGEAVWLRFEPLGGLVTVAGRSLLSRVASFLKLDFYVDIEYNAMQLYCLMTKAQEIIVQGTLTQASMPKINGKIKTQ